MFREEAILLIPNSTLLMSLLDIFTFGPIFILVMVLWYLSNKEIKKSLDQSKITAKILAQDRNTLRLTLIEKEIIPLYAKHLENPAGSEWSAKMARARNLIIGKFSTARALQEYIEKFYIPVARQKHAHKIN